MQISNLPTKIPLPFAASGTKNAIPTASQIGITAGAASLTDGFPPLTFTPIASGGVPPAGADFNGILNLSTSSIQWLNAGGGFPYDAAFSTAIGGYPQGAIIPRSDQTGFWLNQVDNNTTNPETGGANWVPAYNYGEAAITGLTNANVTLTVLQASKTTITLSGTLTGNVQIVFPTWIYSWRIINNTTGAFTATCKTASGSGVAVVQGGATNIYGDGTNIVQSALSQTSADARYTQIANNLSDVASVPTARANLGAAALAGLSTQDFSSNNSLVNGYVKIIGTGSGAGSDRYIGTNGGTSLLLNAPTGAAIQCRINNAVVLAVNSSTVVATGNFQQSANAATSGDLVPWQQVGGLGQAWQDVTASRANNTVYQNTGTKPIKLQICGSGGGLGAVYVDSSSTPTAVGAYFNVGGGVTIGSVTTEVPPGFYYELQNNITLTKWLEEK